MAASADSRYERIVVNGVLLVATVSLALGIFAPILTLRKLVFVTNTFSLYSGVVALLREGEFLLFILIFGFSIVLPWVKIGLLVSLWNRGATIGTSTGRTFRWLAALSKWSMLDVFVVAVLLASVKLGALASVEVHNGLYAFALAVVLIMIATHRVKQDVSPS